MEIERKTITANYERKLLTNMIVSTEFLQQIFLVLNISILKSRYAQIIAEWILEFYRNFKTAPKENIQDVYYTKKKQIIDDSDAELIQTFLSNLSKDYELNNIDYSVSSALDYLKQCSLERMIDSINEHLRTGNIIQAEQAVTQYSIIRAEKDKAIDIIDDTESIVEAFNEENELLFRYPGVLKDIFGDCNRGDFISFLAFSKRGKSWALTYTLECAAHYDLNILFISLEMTQKQVIRRIWQSLTAKPRFDKEIRIPYFVNTKDETKSIEYKVENRGGFPKDRKRIIQAQRKIKRYFRKNKIKLLNLPANSATTDDIEAHLNVFEYYHDFIPDVVIIDYADLIASRKQSEYRHQLDDIWKNLRRIALERNICIITASQSNRYSANRDVSEENVTEDIRKLAHVTRMIGINQNKHDREASVFRMQVLAEREGFHAKEEVITLGCLDIGRICLDSALRKEVNYNPKDEEDEQKMDKEKRKKSLYDV